MFIFSPKIVCNFCLQSSDLRYTHCGRIFTLAVEDHIKQEGNFLSSRRRGGGGSGYPRENFLKTDANGAFLAHFCRLSVDPPPPILSSKLRSSIYVMWENFHLSLEDHIKPKGEFFYPLPVGGGVSPRKFLKNGCKWCILSPFLPIACWFLSPKLCVIFAVKVPISDIRDTGEVFPFLSHGKGGGVLLGFLFFEKRIRNDAF